MQKKVKLQICSLSPRKPNSEEAIDLSKVPVHYEDLRVDLISTFLASGFRRRSEDILLPCPLGTFSNFSSKGADGCTTCPPGILRLVFTGGGIGVGVVVGVVSASD